MNSMKRQKDRTLKDEFPSSVGAQYATGGQWRNNSRKNEEMEPKQKNIQVWMSLVMEIKSNAVKNNTAEEPELLGPWFWNGRPMIQGKLEVIRQEMATVNIDILGISELKWTGVGEFNSDDHYIY